MKKNFLSNKEKNQRWPHMQAAEQPPQHHYICSGILLQTKALAFWTLLKNSNQNYL